MRVFVTGGTGFVGNELLRQLIEAGHVVRCLVRPGSEARLPIYENLEVHLGDATRPETLEQAMVGCQAVIHLVGIIREFPGRGVTFQRMHVEATANVLAAAQAQGVGRYLQMSANGSRDGASTRYHQTKWQAEQLVRQSSLAWTIFRPSVIFGPRDQFINLLVEMVRKAPLVPVVGDGRYRLAPVAVENVAQGFVGALELPASQGQTYHCCGPDSYTFLEILELVGATLGRPKLRTLCQPPLLLRPLVALLQGIPRFPLTTTQMTMLLEGNLCPPDDPWAEQFELQLVSLPAALRRDHGS